MNFCTLLVLSMFLQGTVRNLDCPFYLSSYTPFSYSLYSNPVSYFPLRLYSRELVIFLLMQQLGQRRRRNVCCSSCDLLSQNLQHCRSEEHTSELQSRPHL